MNGISEMRANEFPIVLNTLLFVKKLKIFSQECDAELALKIASDFRELYRRRPAFMDELTKAGF